MVRNSTKKYGNRKVTVDGIEFDSVKEGKRYSALMLMQRCGVISNLELQKKFTLIPAQRDDNGKVIERAVKYKADFTYINSDGKIVVEDVKGYRDPSSAGYAKFVLKRKMMLYFHGIRVIEI